MLHFPKTISLAIKFLNLLTEEKQSITKLAPLVGTSTYNLARIVKSLSAAGLVKSFRGNSGGLVRIDGDISLKTLFDVFHKDPKSELLKSNEIHDKINLIYIIILEQLSIYEGNRALELLESEYKFPSAEPIATTEEVSLESITDVMEESDIKLEEFDWNNGW